jgi:hypothetical protein
VLHKIRTDFLSHLKGNIGWRTNRKIVIFESDDWGSIRMPSRNTYDSLVSKGIKLDSAGGGLFNKYDTLANEDDLNALFDVLTSVKDKNGRHAVFTAVCVVANPDFEKIRASNFEQYFYEPFTTTLEKYQGHTRTFDLWKEGLSKGVFIPQSHGREHLNSILWLEALRSNDKEARIAFDYGMWGYDRSNGPSFQEAFSVGTAEEVVHQAKIIEDGLRNFEAIFGYKSEFFVPPNGLMHRSLEHSAYKMGVKFLYGSVIYKVPTRNYKTRTTFRFLGQKNKYGQRFVLRNCLFEPNDSTFDWVDIAMKDIETAFKYCKPAILGPHRKNFIGGIDEKNRNMGLLALSRLLKAIVKKWPDVEFMSTNELEFN